jgi:predicted ATPase/DNA-binding CsgD family transcriptional regulator
MQQLKIIRPPEKEQVPKHNLPAQLTSLLGREQEVEAACALLRRSEVRLVTLRGTGGVGKTRLALQIAEEVLDDFADGIYFVSLAPLSDPDLVIPTLAQTLGLKEISNQSLLDLLKVYLRNKSLLLVLDNFEQVVTAAPLLVEVLQTCPQLKILVTSRALLRVSGEHEFLVPLLAVPNLKQLPATEVLSQYAAVTLFLQRAQALKPDFHMTATNAQTIAEICVCLDGLPLAIELAAARIKLLSPHTLLARLSQRLQVLTGGKRDAPTRQQTLRNTIAWSYQLLDATEQGLFRRFAIFVGGCTLEAVEAICRALGDETLDVLEGLASLIDKSLVSQTEQEGKEDPCFLMLETIREYGLECLATSGETEATGHAHAVYYLALTEQAAEHWFSAEEQAWLAQLEREHNNLRAAMTWLLEHRTARQSSEMALRLGAALWWFWVTRGYRNEGWSLLERALEGSESVAVPIRAQALWATGNLAGYLGHVERGEVLCQQSLALFQEIGNSTGMRDALFHLGVVADMRGDYAAASSRFEESLVLSRQAGDKADAAWALVYLEQLANIQGEHARVGPLAEESLALFRGAGIQMGTDDALKDWAKAAFFQSDFARAEALAQECVVLERQLGEKAGEAEMLALLGEVALQQGDPPTARLLLEQGCALLREVRWMRAGIDEEQQMAWTLSRLGKVLAIQGNYPAARALYEESLESLVSVQAVNSNRPFLDIYVNLDFALEGLAAVVAVQGELAWAARLWGAAQARRDTRGTPLPPVYRADYDRSVTAARTQLGEKPFVAAWNEGRTMTPEQALAARGPLTIPTLIPAEPATVPPAPKAATYPDRLTAREVEVLRLVAGGLTDHQIAEQLVISPRTVNSHLKAIYGKIQVSSRSAATRYAIEHALM